MSLSTRRIAGVAAALLVVAACGRAAPSMADTTARVRGALFAGVDGSGGPVATQARGTVLDRTESAGGPIALALQVTPVSDAVSFTLAATNTGAKRHEMRFVDGQEVEFLIEDERGRVRWRWSDGRLFTQPMRAHLLDEGEPVRYDATMHRTLGRGVYVARAILRSENHPATASVRFTLP
ncbi:MAG: BsuPI-related putative proteinase inhibitor [Gemmatimonadaceae bacterium]|jgi:hypothetical protein|nr:BsuPI-related putative proteinase inhibitor [Gemmatimonadaceae bacterium]